MYAKGYHESNKMVLIASKLQRKLVEKHPSLADERMPHNQFCTPLNTNHEQGFFRRAKGNGRVGVGGSHLYRGCLA
jgi:hypothetical protein